MSDEVVEGRGGPFRQAIAGVYLYPESKSNEHQHIFESCSFDTGFVRWRLGLFMLLFFSPLFFRS